MVLVLSACCVLLPTSMSLLSISLLLKIFVNWEMHVTGGYTLTCHTFLKLAIHYTCIDTQASWYMLRLYCILLFQMTIDIDTTSETFAREACIWRTWNGCSSKVFKALSMTSVIVLKKKTPKRKWFFGISHYNETNVGIW